MTRWGNRPEQLVTGIAIAIALLVLVVGGIGWSLARLAGWVP